MDRNELSEPEDTIRDLRAKKYPDIPEALVRKILAIEADYPDQDTKPMKLIASIVQEHLEEEPTKTP